MIYSKRYLRRKEKEVFDKMKTVKYLIIGAGISGLAFASQKALDDYLILEKESEPGGYCRTIKRNGFVWDYAGHFFHFRNERLQKEFYDLLHNDSAVFQKKNTSIKYKDRYVDYPFQFNIHQLPKDEFIECLVDLFSKDEVDMNTFKEMLYAKFGKSIADKFLIPYNEKLYACNLDKLDCDAMGRFFPMADPVQIVQSFKKEQIQSYNDSFYYSADGAVAFVNAFLENIDTTKIIYDCKLKRIDTDKHVAYVDGEEICYEHLVSTIPFAELLDITYTEHADCFTSNQVLVFNIGFDGASKDENSHWIYYPENKYCFYRVGYYNNILRCQPMSLYVEIGYKQGEEINVERDFEQTLVDLKKAGIIDKQKPVDWCYMIMNPAYVHISSEAQKEKERIMHEFANENLYCIGRYGSWTYCSIEDCILMAYELAEKI